MTFLLQSTSCLLKLPISLLVPVVLVLVVVSVVDVKAPYCQWNIVVLLLFYKEAFQKGSLL